MRELLLKKESVEMTLKNEIIENNKRVRLLNDEVENTDKSYKEQLEKYKNEAKNAKNRLKEVQIKSAQ